MICYLIAAIIVLAGFCYFSIYASIKKGIIIKKAKKVEKVEKKAAEKRTEVEEKHNEKKSEIISTPGIDHDVLPDGEKRKHNHSFRDPCTPDCPAYDKP